MPKIELNLNNTQFDAFRDILATCESSLISSIGEVTRLLAVDKTLDASQRANAESAKALWTLQKALVHEILETADNAKKPAILKSAIVKPTGFTPEII